MNNNDKKQPSCPEYAIENILFSPAVKEIFHSK
jgi:hypothetical protein